MTHSANPFSDALPVAGGAIIVHPIGFAHHAQLLALLDRIGLEAGSLAQSLARIDAAHTAAILASVSGSARRLLPELLALVDACCQPKLSEVNPPWYVVAEAVEAWWKLNTEGDRARPFVAALESLLGRLSGQPLTLLQIRSLFSLSAGTASPTSSTDDKPDGPTAVGAGPSSAGTTAPPAANASGS